MLSIFVETMDTALDEAIKEALLRDIIAEGSDAISLFLNETNGLEGEGEQAGYGDLMPVQEEEHEDGSGDPMPMQEGDHDDGSGDRTESGQEYILVKLLLTS